MVRVVELCCCFHLVLVGKEKACTGQAVYAYSHQNLGAIPSWEVQGCVWMLMADGVGHATENTDWKSPFCFQEKVCFIACKEKKSH